MTTDRGERSHTDGTDVFIARVAAHYTPPPLTPAQRIAFDRALAERIARRRQIAFRRSLAGLTAATCGAALLWIATHSFDPVAPMQPRESVVIEGVEGLAADETMLLVLADDSVELSGDDGNGGEEDFLPPEYTALAAALDLLGDR